MRDKGVSALGMRDVNMTRRVDEDKDEGINAKRRQMQQKTPAYCQSAMLLCEV